MKDFTDYYAVSWHIIEPPLTYRRSTIEMAPLFVATYIIFELFMAQTGLEIYPPFRPSIINFYRIEAISIMLVFTLIIYKIRTLLGPKVTEYSLDKTGLHVGKKSIKYDALDVEKILRDLENNGKEITVPRKPKRLHIPVPSKEIREKIIKALKQYNSS